MAASSKNENKLPPKMTAAVPCCVPPQRYRDVRLELSLVNKFNAFNGSKISNFLAGASRRGIMSHTTYESYLVRRRARMHDMVCCILAQPSNDN